MADQRDDLSVPELDLGVYVHSKSGKKYKVVGVALHEETLQPLVIYRPLYNTQVVLWARPYDVFIEQIELDGKQVPRFQLVERV
jgi:hypothetical protein